MNQHVPMTDTARARLLEAVETVLPDIAATERTKMSDFLAEKIGLNNIRITLEDETQKLYNKRDSIMRQFKVASEEEFESRINGVTAEERVKADEHARLQTETNNRAENVQPILDYNKKHPESPISTQNIDSILNTSSFSLAFNKKAREVYNVAASIPNVKARMEEYEAAWKESDMADRVAKDLGEQGSRLRMALDDYRVMGHIDEDGARVIMEQLRSHVVNRCINDPAFADGFIKFLPEGGREGFAGNLEKARADLGGKRLANGEVTFQRFQPMWSGTAYL